MTTQSIEVLRKIQTPEPFVKPLETLEAAKAKIATERYAEDRRRELEAEAAEQTARDLADALGAQIAESVRQRDAELRAILADEQAQRNTPKQGPVETASEFAARVGAMTVTELRSTRRANLTVADVQTIAMTTAPEAIAALADDALESHDPDAVRRVLPAALARLDQIVGDEMRAAAGPSLTPSAASTVLVALRGRFDAWRRSPEAQTPAMRRRAVEAAHQARVTSLHQQATNAAEPFGLRPSLDRILKLAAIAGATQ